MIGQRSLLKTIDNNLAAGFPRFSIIAGTAGSGRKMLCKYIADKLSATLVFCDTKVDAVREVIEIAYRQSSPVVYVFADADRMSPNAKNSLLKITEEAPQQAYIIMTLSAAENTLATLRSRGTLFQVHPYTEKEMRECANFSTEAEAAIALKICTVPGEITILKSYDIIAFNQYVNAVVDSLAAASLANVLKIPTKLKVKKEGEGWNVMLFMRAVQYSLLLTYKKTKLLKYYHGISITANYLNQINITGINKAATVDMWLIDLKECLEV